MKKLIILKALVLSVAGLVIFRCFNPFAPKLEDAGNQNLIITEQKTPEEVLQNFKYAYVFKDSVLYSDLLDSSFVFIYFDPNEGSSGRFVSWDLLLFLAENPSSFLGAAVPIFSKYSQNINLLWRTGTGKQLLRCRTESHQISTA